MKRNISIEFGEKVTEKNQEKIILFLEEINRFVEERNGGCISFDLSQTYWIANEQMVLIISLLRRLKNFLSDSKNNFTIEVLLPKERSLDEINTNSKKARKREKLQERLIGTWNIEYNTGLIEQLSNRITNLYTKAERTKSFDLFHHRIIPFQSVPVVSTLMQETIELQYEERLGHLFKLESEINDIVKEHSLETSFEDNSLSKLIINELFLNAFQHAYPKKVKQKECYFAVGLTSKIDIALIYNQVIRKGMVSSISKNKEEIQKEVQWIYEKSIKQIPELIESERCTETIPFFKSKDIPKNESYLELSYLDFGVGISTTLKSEYNKKRLTTKFNLLHDLQNEDTRILEYAFSEGSSRMPISTNIDNHQYIARGLYHLLSKVRQYSGLIVARSNKGKIVFDFSSNTNEVSDCIRYSENDDLLANFKGVQITILIPRSTSNLQLSKPLLVTKTPKYNCQYDAKITEFKYLSVSLIHHQIITQLSQSDDDAKTHVVVSYNAIIQKIHDEILLLQEKDVIVFLDFTGFVLQNHTEKILYYLLTTSNVNEFVRVVACNIDSINTIARVNEFVKIQFSKFATISKVIPCFDFVNQNKDALNRVSWIGLLSEDLHIYLSHSIDTDHTEYPLSRAHFSNEEINHLYGHTFKITNGFDVFSLIPTYRILKENYEFKVKEQIHNTVNGFLLRGNGLKIFLTARGHYQNDFLSLYEPLHNKTLASYFSSLLLNELVGKDNEHEFSFNCIISVTVSSQLLTLAIRDLLNYSSLYSSLKKEEVKIIRLASYFSFDDEEPYKKITDKDRVLIVTDVISTGSLLYKIKDSLRKKGANVVCMMSISDTRMPNKGIVDESISDEVEVSSKYDVEFEKKTLICLTSIPIFKPLKNKSNIVNIERINPVLNAVVEMSAKDSEEGQMILENSKQLVDLLSFENLQIAHIHTNNTHLGYSYDTNKLYTSEDGVILLKKIKESLVSKLEAKSTRLLFNRYSGVLSEIEAFLGRILNSSHQFDLHESARRGILLVSRTRSMLKDTQGDLNNKSYWKSLISILMSIKDGTNVDGSIINEIRNHILLLLNEINEDLNSWDYIFFPTFSGIEHMSKSLLAEIFECYEEAIIPLQRFDTSKGWRFTYPPKLYNRMLKNKSVLILDSGSLTGESLIQMIDSVSFLEVSKITLVSIVGRIEDFEREFHSRIKEFKVKRLKTKQEKEQKTTDLSYEAIVPIDIFFGYNLHIPVYQSDTNCPFCTEKQKLELLVSNYKKHHRVGEEDSIVSYMCKRIGELAVQSIFSIDHFPDYLPRQRRKSNNSNAEHTVDTKSFFLIRDRIGKIVGYRFYTEYYEFFNTIENEGVFNSETKRYNRSEEIESIIAVLLHEPHLIKGIRDLLPKLMELLKKFLIDVVTRNVVLDNLHYVWSEYSIVKASSVIIRERLVKTKGLLEVCEFISYSKDYTPAFNFLSFFYWEMINYPDESNLFDAELLYLNANLKDDQNICGIASELIKYLTLRKIPFDAKNHTNAVYDLMLFYFNEQNQPSHTEIEKDAQRISLSFNNPSFDVFTPFERNLEKNIEDSNSLSELMVKLNGIIISRVKILIDDHYFETDRIIVQNILEFGDLTLIEISEKLVQLNRINKQKLVDIGYYCDDIDLVNINKNRAVIGKLLQIVRNHFIDKSSDFALFLKKYKTDPVALLVSYFESRTEREDLKVVFDLEMVRKFHGKFNCFIHEMSLKQVLGTLVDNIEALEQKEGMKVEISISQTGDFVDIILHQNWPFPIRQDAFHFGGIDRSKEILKKFMGTMHISREKNSATFFITLKLDENRF